jgi:hypothetical protein
MADDDMEHPERPRVEPEIIPPERDERAPQWRRSPWDGPFNGTRTTQRVFVTKLGPFGIALVVLALAVIVAIIIIAALGAVLIWIPVIVAVIAVAAVLRLLRILGMR